jgi:hypothetical protein
MENIVGFQHAGHSYHQERGGFLKQEDPLFPCTAVSRKHVLACYLMQSSAILKLNGYDFEQAFLECDKAPDDMIRICYQSMGRDISGFTQREIERTHWLCGLGRADYIGSCLGGAVKDFIYTDAEPQMGILICRTVGTSYMGQCYAAVGEFLADLIPDLEARREACASVEEPYVRLCQGP